jgi:HlyD family secretion protein
MNATVSFYNDAKAAPASEAKRVIVIPQGAVQNGSVFVVANGHARKRPVTIGGASERGVLVESGLIGGEDLIVSPPASLKDGQKVEVKQ